MRHNSARPRLRAALGAVAIGCTGLAVLVPGDAGASETRPTATHNVAVAKGRFVPDNLGIDVGDKVRWVNTDARQVRIVSTHGPRKFAMGKRDTLDRGESWKIRFNREGRYLYRDTISGAVGEIRVGPDERTAPPRGNGYGFGTLEPVRPR